MRIEYSRSAQRQLRDIYDYIARDKAGAAARTIARIRQSIDALSEFPELGRVGEIEGTRELLIARLPYLAVYQTRASAIRVIGILHAAQRK